MTRHQHREAFALMQYESDDGSVREVIWNSRDGVTPFCGTSRDGDTQLTHVRWHEDRYAPDHVPALGDRIFVDLTRDRAMALAEKNAQRFWDTYPPTREQFASVEECAEVLAAGYMGTPDAPHLEVVAG